MNNKNFNIIEVTGCHGGECHLVRYGRGAALCDTGFAFAAPTVANNISKTIGGDALDSILLTHAHYDHAGGAPYVKAAFPEANLIANELTAEIFTRPGALRTMREMTAAARAEFGRDMAKMTEEDEKDMTNDLLDSFSADILVSAEANGTRVAEGILAYATPGHTRDMTSYYFDKLDLLLATETTGVIASSTAPCASPASRSRDIQGGKQINPTFITGYAQALSVSKQMKEIGAKYILTPHYGLISGTEALEFPDKTRAANEAFAEFVMSRHNRGLTEDEILRDYFAEYYEKLIRPTGKQPLPAVLANVRVMIPRLITELESSI
jgi:glyoxylase-like metal-dependent hydrolase (beta-lactamase superfamily II)